ncbi:MAG: hypothetical protein KDB58_13925 [Solirubrobacterales bacterium]|nr:hypothetical protein [Solirubrobacterales bacterium]
MTKRTWIGAIALAIVMAFTAQPAFAGLGDVETPTVEGPEASGPGNTPFLATDIDLASKGYVEEEYEYSGDAFRYDRTGADDVTATKITTGGPNSDGKFPYRTRMIVRRPANPADFNGTVVVEWLNVTAGFDVEWNWMGDPQYLIDNGYAWVGISAQNVGINALKGFNPTRYGDLVNPDPLPNPQSDSDALSFEIYSAGIKALLDAGNGADPLPGMTPSTVIASGESQSGSRMSAYYNKIQPLHELVDAFLITVSTGTLRDDRPEKAIRVISETENRTQRTEPDNSTYRQWEVAGGSHLPRMAWDNAEGPLTRDLGTLDVDCQKFPLSRVQWPFVVNSAIADLVTWSGGGAAPPIGPRGVYTDPTTLERDQYGIGKGGIRLPAVDIPVEVNTGVNAAEPGGPPLSVFCVLLGSSEVLPDSTLTSLYHDYGDYVDKTAPAVQAVADQGFIVQGDVPRLQQMYEEVPYLRPTVPVPDKDATRGDLTLTWRGTEAAQSTFALEHSKDKGATWSPVSGAEALASPTFTFPGKGETDGKWIYRVRSSTIIPANVEAPETTVTTPYSDSSGQVIADRKGPKLKLKCPKKVKRGSKAFVKVKAKDKGVGLKKKPKSKIRINTKRPGVRKITAKAKDKLGNKSKKSCKVKVVK